MYSHRRVWISKGELFVTERQPWCKPGLVTVENVIDVVERCPSGEPSYKSKD